MRAVVIGFFTVFELFLGYIADALGITHPAIDAPTVPPIPAGSAITWILGAFVWVYNALAALIQLITFQLNIPLIATFLLIGVQVVALIVTIQLVRGD